MKKCTQCGQVLSDDAKFCFNCGGDNFEPVSGQQQDYQQQTGYQPPPQSYQQPIYSNNTYIQQPYQAPYVNNEPATIGDYLLFWLFMIIPIFNIVYLIMVAVGGPKYKQSMTNFARATLIMIAISIVLEIIIFAIIGFSLANLFDAGRFNGYY